MTPASPDEPTPRPPQYAPLLELAVGQTVLELAERMSYARTDDGAPRVEARKKVLILAVRAEIESAAEARALAAAIETIAKKLDDSA